MSLITLAVSAFGFVADSVSLGKFISDALSARRNTTGPELFAKCFKTAVKRSSPELAAFTASRDAQDVRVDSKKLEEVIAETERIVNPPWSKRNDIVRNLAPLFRPCVVLRGDRPSLDAFDPHIVRILDTAFLDFFSRLPSHAQAVREAEVAHIEITGEEHRGQEVLLRQILERLDAKQQEVRSTVPYLDPTVIQQESSRLEHRNPFRIVKAEDFDHDYDRLARLFREPSHYDDIQGKDNLILEGGRGCGKSMILRAMSARAAVQVERLRREARGLPAPAAKFSLMDSGLHYFGVYIKLARGYFYEWSPDCKLTKDSATQLFQHVFNMLLLDSLIDGLVDARSAHLLDIESQVEEALVNELGEILGVASEAKTFRDFRRAIRDQQQHVAQYLGQLRLGGGEPKYQGRHTYIHDFIDACCRAVKERIAALKESRIYFLLDEYENLATFQQRVVNTLAKLRPTTLTVKIATRAFGVKSVTDLQGEPIQRPRDYQVVTLDYDVRDKQYAALLLEIGRKRLIAERFENTDLRQLLLKPPEYHPVGQTAVESALELFLQSRGKDRGNLSEKEWNEWIHRFGEAMVFRLSTTRQPRTYAGFEDFVHLSSGIISNFLELCKMAFYMADGEGVDLRSGEPVPYDVQNRAVYHTSQAAFDWIARNIENTGPAISRLVFDLADVFREKLQTHSSEPEAARIVIEDPARLDAGHDLLRAVLEDAVRWSVLHAPGQANAYFPKHASEPRSTDYYVSRVLAPILRISPRPRWRTYFSAAELAGLLDESTRNATRTRLMRKHAGKSRRPAGPHLFGEPPTGEEAEP